MSTVVAAKRNGILAIGADTLTKHGGIKVQAKYKRDHSKIVRVGKGHLAFVGYGIWEQVLTEYFGKLKETPALDSSQAVYRALCKMHDKLKKKQFLKPDSYEFEDTGLVGLLANPHGIFAIFSDRSVIELERFYAFGSGSHFALGAMHRAYGSGESTEGIVRAGIEASAEFDEHTSLPLEVRTIEMISRSRAGLLASNGRETA